MGVQVIKYSYARIRRRWRRPARGFRLTPTRLSVHALRAKLWTLLGLMGRCTRNVRLLTTGLVAAARGRRTLLGSLDGGRTPGNKGAPVATAQAAGNNGKSRRPPCMRSNSFYARAVAECLDFIKGSNATPVDNNRRAAAAVSVCDS